MHIPLVFISIWLAFVIFNLIYPKWTLPMGERYMKFLGKFYGFKVEPESEEVRINKARRWYVSMLVLGFFILYLAISGKLK